VSRPALAGNPTGHVAVPAAVAELAGADRIVPVWRNQLGGLTFRLDGDGPVRYVKWAASGTPEVDFRTEAERLRWARGRVPIPRVLAQDGDADGTWLVTAALPGRSAVDPHWIAEPATAATAIGRGLRLLHDALPVEDCPFDWGIGRRTAQADHRLADGDGHGPAAWATEHRDLGVAEARARIGRPPPIDRLVVCHGDASAPNTLLHDDGTFAAHVDLGRLGVADRWADLAIAAWSTEWNYGPGYDGHVFEGYGIAPDPRRIAYYRLLWDLS
jgi:kanamycin kinase